MRRSVLFCMTAPAIGTLPLPALQNAPAAAGEDFCKKPLDQGKVDAAIKKDVTYLINDQNPDGSWKPEDENKPLRYEQFSSVTSTVYALLFLKRASSGLMDTGSKTPEKFIDND